MQMKVYSVLTFLLVCLFRQTTGTAGSIRKVLLGSFKKPLRPLSQTTLVPRCYTGVVIKIQQVLLSLLQNKFQ